MRVFLCVYNNFTVAVPMDSVSAVAVNGGPEIENTCKVKDDCISLPVMFDNLESVTRHSIVLKSKVTLLTTEIECETEIPDNMIFPLPNIFNSSLFSYLFNGIVFLAAQDKPVLLLNSEEIIKLIMKEKKND